MSSEKKIILVDSNNVAYRAFYALPAAISTSTGTITNAVYGFTAMILKLIEEQRPDIIICAFDSKWPTFRHELFKEYKAQRKKMPSELSEQMLLIREVMEAFNIRTIEAPGFEADDIIASITKKTEDLNSDIIILSSDKDILQLVSERVKVISIKKGITDTILYDSSKVIERFGIEPSKIKDLLALMGDSSDNIPGVQGIGPKTALELVSRFGSLESIYENIDAIENEKLKKLLTVNEENARKSRTLTELKDDLELNMEDLFGPGVSAFEYEKVENIFSSLEFNTLKKRAKDIAGLYISAGKDEAGIPEHTSPGVLPEKNKQRKNIYLSLQKYLDAEEPGDKKLYLSGVTCPAGSQKNMPSDNGDFGLCQDKIIIGDGRDSFCLFDSNSLLKPLIRQKLLEIFDNPEVNIVGFDLKQTCKTLMRYKIEINAPITDLKILYLLLNPVKPDVAFADIAGNMQGIDIDSEAEKYDFAIHDKDNKDYNEKRSGPAKMTPPTEEKQMFFSFEEGKTPIMETIEDYTDFIKINQNSFMQMILFPGIGSLLSEKIKVEGFKQLYEDIEAPLVKVLAFIEFTGVNIDREYLNELIKQYELDIKALTSDIFSLCNSEFNINSTQQLADILYKKLNLSATKKTKTGFSTDAATLFAIYDSHPVIGKVLDYREKVKLKNTYLDVLPTLIDHSDNRVHTTYNQLGTTTGRISSNNPNLQNIPVRTELGRKIRKAFIPGAGYDILLSADYSQIELRILAHLSGDIDLISAFNSGQDIHSRTASEIFGLDYSDIDENLRRKAKAINFGIIYGMTEFGLKSRLAISEEEAREYIRLYFTRYPGVKQFLGQLIESAYRTGFTTTMFGRKRYIKELASTNANLRSLGERLAVNTPIQGSAADIMKLATVMLYKNLKTAGLDSNIILHVHDEIVLELKQHDLDAVKAVVTDSMENCVKLKAALKVDLKSGKNWYI